MSRPVSLIDWNNPPQLQNEEFVVETSYDALNRPLALTQPDGKVISYSYDKGGLLKTVRADAVLHVSNITYNPKGQREHIYFGNNTKTRYEYNPLNFRLTRLLTTRNNGQDILQDLNYSYDPVGNIIQQRDNAQQTHYFANQQMEPVSSYEYDALYRLIKATGRELTSLTAPNENDFVNNISVPNPAANAMQNYAHNYQYDALGNILQDAWKNYQYATANNYLLGNNNIANQYSYDAHGNMLKMPHLSSMVYDYQNQLVSASNGTFTSYYNYDTQGNRTRKVVDKGYIREERYYVGGYEIYRKYVNDTLDLERSTVNVSDDEKVFVRIETKTGEAPLVRYQYDNHLGSACLELDKIGAIISYEEYHPFGTTSYRSGRSETEVSLKRYKYCGKERDEETGLYYYGMRYYAAWLCRFINVDPLQFKYPYYTPYQYAGNKPISYIDLDGAEEYPNPFDQAFKELENLWNYVIGEMKSVFSSKSKPEAIKEEPKTVDKAQNRKEEPEVKPSTIKPIDNVKFVGNAKSSDVSQYTINLLSIVTKKMGIEEIIVSSTKRNSTSQINAMYTNVERTGLEEQLKTYNDKGDAVFLAYQAAKDAGKSEQEIKEVMILKAIEVGFMSKHSNPDYDQLNAIDIPYLSMKLSTKQLQNLKTAIQEQDSRIFLMKENNVLHVEIPQSKE